MDCDTLECLLGQILGILEHAAVYFLLRCIRQEGNVLWNEQRSLHSVERMSVKEVSGTYAHRSPLSNIGGVI